SGNPNRIAFFDDEVESIRTFDIHTQMSNPNELQELCIPPALFSLNPQESESIQSQVQKSNFEGFSKDIASFGFWFLGEGAHFLPLQYCTLLTQEALSEASEIYSLNPMEKALPLKDIESLCVCEICEGYSDISFVPNNLVSMIRTHSNRAITLITHNDIKLKAYDKSDLEGVKIKHSSAVVNLITPDELLLSLNTFAPKLKHKKPTLKLNEIAQGEYVVHSEYGIGLFMGLKSAQIAGVVRDFIEIAYQGEDRLLLPVENLNMIDRYVADSGQIPLLDRLGKGSFAKLKQKVRVKLLEIANGIIELAAKRNLLQGIKIEVQNPALLTFQNACGFTLTKDQVRSIEEIYADLSSGKVMDRLLSGDVGFGKTEVAMNAIYATYLSGYQSAMIVPTTLLCSQHYHALVARLSPFGVRVGRCDRFLKGSEKKQLFWALKNNEVQVVVGTHALFGAEFAKLGLIVVDEEHKFGVKQKERIKEISANTHLLSMSATPIPRTLNMALSQIKSLSSLQTPPMDRIPVRTFIKVSKDSLLKEVILRELRRGGQVFYIHNNIASIQKRANELQSLLPQLKIAILHSQVDNATSEAIMCDFAANKYNLLLCTSIVESGIHLPNANTIIVAVADRFGIADLHQLRGRVGRSNKEGFCYFLLQDMDSITPEAKKRLMALEKNSYLGSGENLAYYDLEIRGGGNLLGEAQSGHIKNIGYGLYLRMLEECIHYLSGKGVAAQSQCDLKLNINAYLNPQLIASDKLRLELYRRLSLCENISAVNDIESEIFDRFGGLDKESEAFLELIRIKVLANACALKQIMHYGQNITFVYADNSKESVVSPSKDWDDVMESIMVFLRKKLQK
ncbi:transcription-repair coupling factor, partial [uncultured Helicobacter sp.]